MCYDQIQIVKTGVGNAQHPNINAIAQQLFATGHSCQQWKLYASKCGQDYKFCGDSALLKD